MTLIILLVVLFVIVLVFIGMYNRLVSLAARVKEAWADIDVQLKRRYDLIPNLVETVKGYAAHESGTLEKVITARNSAMSATTPDNKAVAEGELAGALKSVFALAENYPTLKANENFLALQNELTDTENKIQAARRFYNGVVMELNTAIKQFPGNIIANSFGFTSAEFFELGEADSAAREPVKVQF